MVYFIKFNEKCIGIAELTCYLHHPRHIHLTYNILLITWYMQVMQGLRNKYPALSTLASKNERGKNETTSVSKSQSTCKPDASLVETKVGLNANNKTQYFYEFLNLYLKKKYFAYSECYQI